MVGTPMQRYVVLDYLAEGGMGAIYLGKKLGAGGFEKDVVLKQLLPEFTKQPEFIDLFLREARISATLDHANIVHTIDLVRMGEEFFIVMEYVRGGDLRTLLKRSKRRKKRLPPAVAILIASEVLSALAYAHAKLGADGLPLGLIHRDVSPSNILVSGDGEVKLTDFGIAKASTHNSVFYRVKGKVGYMSPEQAKNESLDTRSDLYSLAVILYEMLTGERLFVAAGLTTSADELYSTPVPPVSRKRQDLPRELDQLMLRALALDPRDRYQSARELQDALLKVASRAGLQLGTQELARRLVDACGPVVEWESAEVSMSPQTEAYVLQQGQGQGTDRIKLHDLLDDEEDLDGLQASSAPRRDPVAPRAPVRSLAPTPRLPAPQRSTTPEPTSSDLLEEVDEDDFDDGDDEDAAWAADALPRRASGPLAPAERKQLGVTVSQRLAGVEITSMIQVGELDGDLDGGLDDASGDDDGPARAEPWRERGGSSPPRRTGGGTSRAAETTRTPSRTRRKQGGSRFAIVLFLIVLALGAAAIALAIAFTGTSIDPVAPVVRPRAVPPVTAPTPAATSSLELTSVPSGARVFVDDRELCKTPCQTEDVGTSTALVRVEREGYLPWTSLVNFGQLAHSKRVARLRKRPKDAGRILVKTDAPCELLVDGEKIGHVTSAGPLELRAGRVELTVLAASGATTSLVVEIEEGRTIERTITMP